MIARVLEPNGLKAADQRLNIWGASDADRRPPEKTHK